MKKKLTKTLTTVIIIISFLWSECVWAIGIEHPILPSEIKKEISTKTPDFRFKEPILKLKELFNNTAKKSFKTALYFYNGTGESFTRTGIKYNGKGQITGFEEEGTQSGRGSYKTTRSGMEYKGYLLDKYHEESSYADGSKIMFDRSGIGYNSIGQITNYHEEGDRLGAGHYSLDKKEIQYNEKGQITKYSESGSNQQGNYGYTRDRIEYDGQGRVSGYYENGTDTKGRSGSGDPATGGSYSLHRFEMQYHNNGLLQSFKETGKEGQGETFNMQYNQKGQLISQELKSDKDSFQFQGNSKYTFTYNDQGNLTETKIDTPDYWVTFNGKGEQTGQGWSQQMQDYIDWQYRCAVAAAQARANAEAARQNAGSADKKTAQINNEKAKLKQNRVKETKINSIRAPVISKPKSISTSIKQPIASLRAVNLPSKANRSSGVAKNTSEVAIASSRVDSSEVRSGMIGAGFAGKAKTPSSIIKGIMNAPKIEGSMVDKDMLKQSIKAKIDKDGFKTVETKLQDGTTKIMIQDTYTGNTTILQLDKDSDVTARENINPAEGYHSIEFHNYTKDSVGNITADDYTRTIRSSVVAKNTSEAAIVSSRVDSSEVKTGMIGDSPEVGIGSQTTTITEKGHIEYNSLGQITSADITRTITGMLDDSSGVTPVGSPEVAQAGYTETIQISTTTDSNGLIASQRTESTISQKITGTNLTRETKTVTDRTNSYGTDGRLTGWQETEKSYIKDPLSTGKYQATDFIDTGLTINRSMSDITYNQSGQMSAYNLTEHRFGIVTSSGVALDSPEVGTGLDVTTVQQRYEMSYSLDGSLSSYKQDNWSSAAPDLYQHSEIINISYNSDNQMAGYTEYYSDTTGVSSITVRSGITYNALGQITGYTDTSEVARRDSSEVGVVVTVMSNMTYHPDGSLNGYSQTSGDIYTNSKGQSALINKSNMTINSTKYNGLGLVTQKIGTVAGQSYEITYKSYDLAGRPTAWTEERGDITSKHYSVSYNNEGRISEEKVKIKAEQGFSETVMVSEYKYSYDTFGNRVTDYENELYRQTSTSFIGQVLDIAGTVLQIASIIIPGMQWLQPISWAFNAVTSIVKGDVLGFAMQTMGQIFGAVTGGIFGGANEGQFSGLISNVFSVGGLGTPVSSITKVIQVFQAIDGLIGSLTGKSLTESVFGGNAGIINAVIGGLSGLLSGGIEGINTYSLIAFAGKIIASAVIQNSPNTFGQWGTFIQSYINQALQAWSGTMANKKETLTDNLAAKEIETKTPITNQNGEQTGELINYKDGSQAQLDINGNPIWYTDPQGNEYLFGVNNEITDVIGKDAYKDGSMPVINKEGLIVGSYKTDEDGKYTYYDWTGSKVYEQDKSGNITLYDNKGYFEAFIPSGNEPMYNTDGPDGSFASYGTGRVIGSYITADSSGVALVGSPEVAAGITYIYNEKGQIDSSITPAISNGKVQGYYIDTVNTTTYTDNQGIPIWYTNNITPNSPVYFLDPFNQTISGQLLTKVGENSLIQGYIYQDLQKNEYTFYDEQGKQLLPAINPTEIKQNITSIATYIKTELTNAIAQGKADVTREQYLLQTGSNVFALDEFSTDNGGTFTAILRALPLDGGVAGALQQLLFNQIDGGQDLAFQRFASAVTSGKDPKVLYDASDPSEQAKYNNFIAKVQSSDLQKQFNISTNTVSVEDLINNLKAYLQIDENGISQINFLENPAAILEYKKYQDLIELFHGGTPNLDKKLIISFDFNRKESKPWFDRLSESSHNIAEVIKSKLDINSGSNFAIAGETLVWSLVDLPVAVILDFPASIGHLGEGTGVFFGNPSLENFAGVAQDISTAAFMLAMVGGKLPSMNGKYGSVSTEKINNYQYNVLNPGPLSIEEASTFASGKYNVNTIGELKTMGFIDDSGALYRGGVQGKAFGSSYTFKPVVSEVQLRIDYAVKRYWVDAKTGIYRGQSPIDTVYKIKFTDDKVVYWGPVSDQGGVYLGGKDRIQIHVKDSSIDGVIENKWSIKNK